MKKRFLTIAAISMLSATTLASCGSNDDGSIVFWHCLGHDKAEVLQSIADKFNKQYEGKYKVRLESIAGDYDSLADNLYNKMSSGSSCDMTMGYPDSFSEYIDDDELLKLDNFINSSDPALGYTEAEIKDFVKEYYNEGQHYQVGGTWSMPLYKSTEAMFYNADFFDGNNPESEARQAKEYKAWEKANTSATAAEKTQKRAEIVAQYTYKYYIDEAGNIGSEAAVNAKRVPVYWDEMIKVGRAVLKNRADAGLSNKTYFPIGYDSDSNLYISQFKQRDIGYTTNENIKNKTDHLLFSGNNEEAVKFVTEVTNYVSEGVLITKGSQGGTEYTNKHFNQGNMLMCIGSTGGSTYQMSDTYSIKLAPVPYYNPVTAGSLKDGTVTAREGRKPSYILQGPSIALFNTGETEKQNGAWLFYKMIADPENNAKVAFENSYDPVRVSSYTTDFYTKALADADKPANLKKLNYQVPKVTSVIKDYYMTSPVFHGSAGARRYIGNLTSYVKQGMSVVDALNEAYSQAARTLK